MKCQKHTNLVDQINIDQWAQSLIAKYPQVREVFLCGSRAYSGGCPCGNSDWDILLVLSKEAYEIPENGERLEQKITFDSEIRFNGLDLFFYGPGWRLARWEWKPGDDISFIDDWDETCRLMFLNGAPIGDFSRFWSDLEHAQSLF